MPDETENDPESRAGQPVDPRAPGPTGEDHAWSTEHYGFAGPADVVTPHPETATAPAAPPADVGEARSVTVRTLAAAGVAAAVFAVGALGFTVGHAAADGPHQAAGTSEVRGPAGPGGRGPGR